MKISVKQLRKIIKETFDQIPTSGDPAKQLYDILEALIQDRDATQSATIGQILRTLENAGCEVTRLNSACSRLLTMDLGKERQEWLEHLQRYCNVTVKSCPGDINELMSEIQSLV